ncbi:type II toxin-antitoxin system CcdA family antitoxin [Halomonas kenyensis]|uniref:Type II toxin-antitoxin system CcdA family antitoxin n=2 Tax=Billgrantia kenyensis TaxID=321266 RepID=A0A7W0AG78_9GAMM|nr:type II toxin-antitoxin system CcdA family antitoxin [Halomonas kenyensis]MCG6659945.1 type II toxin-antitoxin system CcdA family antitoxin [Halomonas kenyensis]
MTSPLVVLRSFHQEHVAAKGVRRGDTEVIRCASALLKEAKALGINISRAAEAGIAEAVKRHKQEQWLKENSSALASSNAYVEANGLPLARHRQ